MDKGQKLVASLKEVSVILHANNHAKLLALLGTG